MGAGFSGVLVPLPRVQHRRCGAAVAAWLLASSLLAQERVVVEELASVWGRVRVSDGAATGLRCLDFPPGRVLQSCMLLVRPDELVLPYQQAMVTALAVPAVPRRVLVVGLGGGSQPRWLARHFPESTVTAVEIDPTVVDLCRRHFGVPDRVEVVIQDAAVFLARTGRRWDVILLDAYGPDEVPEALVSAEFFRLVRRRLWAGGAAATNLWEDPGRTLLERRLAAFRDAFPDALLVLPEDALERRRLESAGATVPAAFGLNRIAVGANAGALDRAAWERRAAALTAARHLDVDLGKLVGRGAQPAATP